MPDENELQSATDLAVTLAWSTAAVVAAFAFGVILTWVLRRLGRHSGVLDDVAVLTRMPLRATEPSRANWLGQQPLSADLSTERTMHIVTVLESPIPRFHLAVPVDDLDAARHFYGTVLGLPQGRSADSWVDWDLHGHQFVTHLAPGRPSRVHNPVDGHDVPVPHFGLLLSVAEFHRLAARLRAEDTQFVIEPYQRFEGQTGEQWTMFLLDPAGNALEFKAFADDSQVFATGADQ